MPRKSSSATAAAAAGDSGAEPRRSSRIKDQPKPEPAKRAPTKPRVKKADKEKAEVSEDIEEKPKSARGKKRKEPEGAEANGAAAAPEGEDEQPPAKKVRAPFFLLHIDVIYTHLISSLLILD